MFQHVRLERLPSSCVGKDPKSTVRKRELLISSGPGAEEGPTACRALTLPATRGAWAMDRSPVPRYATFPCSLFNALSSWSPPAWVLDTFLPVTRTIASRSLMGSQWRRGYRCGSSAWQMRRCKIHAGSLSSLRARALSLFYMSPLLLLDLFISFFMPLHLLIFLPSVARSQPLSSLTQIDRRSKS